MDPHSSELARHTLEVYADLLSPQYRALRAQLVGALASNDVTLESLRHHDAQEKHNFALVHDFIGGLPQGHGQIETPDAYTARQVQANVLWVNITYDSSGRGRWGHFAPFYVIGAKAADAEEYAYGRSPATNLLLFSADPDSRETLRYATVWDDQLAETIQQAQHVTQTEFKPEQLRQMFSRGTGNLHVGPRTSGSMATRVSNDYTLVIQPRFRDREKLIATKGMFIKTSRYIHDNQANSMSDRMLAEYDVFSHLNRLAVAFDKVDLLKSLLDRRVGQAQPDPVDERYGKLAVTDAEREVRKATAAQALPATKAADKA